MLISKDSSIENLLDCKFIISESLEDSNYIK